jgi:hypothetical protein
MIPCSYKEASMSALPQVEHAEAAQLSERDRAILAFEREWWRYSGAKEQAIKDIFEMTPAGYYQVLNGLLDDPAALAQDPMLVKRLLRLRAQRHSARTGRPVSA